MDSYALQFYFAAVGWVFWPRGPDETLHRVQPDLGMTLLFGRQPSVPDIYAGCSSARVVKFIPGPDDATIRVSAAAGDM